MQISTTTSIVYHFHAKVGPYNWFSFLNISLGTYSNYNVLIFSGGNSFQLENSLSAFIQAFKYSNTGSEFDEQMSHANKVMTSTV